MVYRFSIVITQEGKWFVAYCTELGVASQGRTIEQAQENVREAIELYLEDQPKTKLKRLLSKRAPILTSLDVKYG